ncbi:hypothetical protein B566_EDAN005428 [Ephemera danica]|nr:hypothetical protein B566_EDAN005428 [Ephemera danica]
MSGKEDSIVAKHWEYIDPTPDIFALFQQFDQRFFDGRLQCVEGRGGLCSIRLSLPLLKLRPRKDLVETLLIYHSFHEEVKLYKQHIWRCDGPCQSRKPFYGFVRRSMNRAPSSRDLWWAEHQATCGGKFTKIQEPPDYQQKTSKGKKKAFIIV